MSEPFPDWLEHLAFGLLFGGGFGLWALGRWHSMRGRPLWRALDPAVDYEVEYDDERGLAFRNRSGRQTSIRELGGQWQVEVFGLTRLGSRSSLIVGRSGLSGVLFNGERVSDVVIGDHAFDRVFKVGGSDPDVVRGVFANDDVKAAFRDVFNAMTVTRCMLIGDSLVVEFAATHVLGRTALRRIALVRHLADVLDRASAAAALRNAATVPAASGSSSSGSPVGVPIR